MFKSIRFKITLMFVLLTLSIVILISTFMVNSTDSYYHNEFKNLMSVVFNDDYSNQLSAKLDSETPAKDIYTNLTEYYSVQIGIDSFRNVYILSGKTGKAIPGCSSNESLAQSLDISTNIITAMNGNCGNDVNNALPYMDYAVPISKNDNVEYIVYIRDTKEEANSIIGNIFTIMLSSMLMALGISLLFALLLSKTILSPIQSLTQKSKKIASGDFESEIEVTGSDEIGKLTENFNQMAHELKNTLNAIQSEKDKVETILRYMTDGIIAFDRKGEIIHVNPVARKLMNIRSGHFPTFDELFSEIDITITQISYLGHYESTERRMRINNTELSIYFAPFKTNKRSSGLVAVIQDITEQQKLENARREFVANVSHELRTPLTTVKSYAETLVEIIEDDEINKDMISNFLETINNETDRMTRLVKDLLLLSRLDYGINDMYKEFFSIGDLVDDTVNRVKIHAQEKRQKIVYEPTNALPPYYGNSDRIEQVITNIITNAIKYTPDGGSITISTMFMYNSIIIKVKDTGIGIPEESLKHIFERFYRVDKARSRQMGGTGLGLAIAKEIVEAHNGNITISSVPDYGTDVMITLPIPENSQSDLKEQK